MINIIIILFLIFNLLVNINLTNLLYDLGYVIKILLEGEDDE